MQEQLPALPPELLEPIARLALEAAGGDVRVWARLSLVNTAFREAVRGGRSALRSPCRYLPSSGRVQTSTRSPCHHHPHMVPAHS